MFAITLPKLDDLSVVTQWQNQADYSHVQHWVIPVVAKGDVWDRQHDIILGQIKDHSGIEGVDIRLDYTRIIWRCQVPLVEDMVDRDISEDCSGKVGKDVEWIGIL